MISNPLQYESRYHLYEQFESHIKGFTDNLWVVEVLTGDRCHQITSRSNPQHIQLTSTRENAVIWLKEAAWNVGASRLPSEAKYIAFLDADVHFTNPNWIEDTLNALQHFQVVQPFESLVNLTSTGSFLDTWQSLGWCHMTGKKISSQASSTSGSIFGHPGMGLCLKKETFSQLGQWLDHAILGAGDHHMMMGLLGRIDESYPAAISPVYKRHCLAWQERAETHVRRSLGAVRGTITHAWHGNHRDRKYIQRWDTLLKHNYDPDVDLTYDHQGLPQLTHVGMRMHNDLIAYMSQRNEDSIL